MKIQSLSVVVPNTKCVNSCAFCVSKMHCDDVRNQMDSNLPFYDLYEKDYIRRMEFARDNGCNTIMLTGNSEPQQNRGFLAKFGTMNEHLSKPFRWIEMQTTGVLLDDPYLRFLRNHVGVSTISISVSSLDNDINALYNGTPESLKVSLEKLCESIKKYDFNLRMSVNLTDAFSNITASKIIKTIRDLYHADQITFRVLYVSQNNTPQDQWIREHAYSESATQELSAYIQSAGKPLEILPFGATKYSLGGCSVVFDNDCMSKIPKEQLKYLVLKPNCKLYTKWDDPASLVF